MHITFTTIVGEKVEIALQNGEKVILNGGLTIECGSVVPSEVMYQVNIAFNRNQNTANGKIGAIKAVRSVMPEGRRSLAEAKQLVEHAMDVGTVLLPFSLTAHSWNALVSELPEDFGATRQKI